jgi:hypothetical protein
VQDANFRWTALLLRDLQSRAFPRFVSFVFFSEGCYRVERASHPETSTTFYDACTCRHSLLRWPLRSMPAHWSQKADPSWGHLLRVVAVHEFWGGESKGRGRCK